jgi:hypothetical protein
VLTNNCEPSANVIIGSTFSLLIRSSPTLWNLLEPCESPIRVPFGCYDSPMTGESRRLMQDTGQITSTLFIVWTVMLGRKSSVY